MGRKVIKVSIRWNEFTREQVEKIRSRYTGKRIRLISMTDPWTTLPSGLMGTCEGVDDMGQLLMRLDNGSGLNLILGEDSFEVIDKE